LNDACLRYLIQRDNAIFVPANFNAFQPLTQKKQSISPPPLPAHSHRTRFTLPQIALILSASPYNPAVHYNTREIVGEGLVAVLAPLRQLAATLLCFISPPQQVEIAKIDGEASPAAQLQ